MRWASSTLALAGLLGLPMVATGCGAAGGDPVAVAQDYINAVKGNPAGGTQFLESESTEKLTGSTSLSRFLGTNKGATAEIVSLPWIPPTQSAAVPSKKQCLIGQGNPAPSQICIVTVKVTGGKPAPAYFHINFENRYTGKWQIINVDEVDKAPDNLLPTGNQAHGA
ncbi:MAG TPA: hypothetical protein VIN56_10930 [Candidatus Dormibacteraeota bacterium]|jgi:hypothetical protein